MYMTIAVYLVRDMLVLNIIDITQTALLCNQHFNMLTVTEFMDNKTQEGRAWNC
jgi:hypothetical protein